MAVEPLTNTITLPLGLEAVVREADGNAERILFSKKSKIHQALPGYWAACTLRLGEIEKPSREDILNLKEPDQTFLAIEIYRATFGDKLILQGDDPDTGRPAGFEVNLAKLDVMPIPDGQTGPDPVFAFVLPKTGQRVEYGYLSGHQMLEELEREDICPARMDFARIRSIDGSSKVTMKQVESWPLSDMRALREDFHRTRCGYDPRIRFKNENGREVVMNLLTDPQFLFPGQRHTR
jgi:hypothetical protein